MNRGRPQGVRSRLHAPRHGAAALALAGLLAAAQAGAAPAPADSTGPAGATTLRREALIAAHGDGRGQVLEPAGIAADAFGRIYVTDAALHRLQRLGPDGGFLGEAGTLGSRPGELRRPGAVALLGALGVAVLDRENRRVAAYDLFGRFLGILLDLVAEPLAGEIGRVDPVGLATDRGGALYVADADRDRLLVFDFAGLYQRTLGGFGAKAGSFRGLAGVAVGPDGVIVTAERGARRVQRLDAGGRPLDSWPIDVSPSGGPLGLAVDDSGRVAVADPEGDRVLWFAAPGAAPQRCAVRTPRALAFTTGRRLLVAGNGEVARYAVGRAPAAEPEE